MRRELLTAEVVYNGLGLPRLGGAVLVERASDEASDERAHIVAIDDAALLRRSYPEALEREVGFALSPPLVNAHTHLDLSTMPYQPSGYGAFIGRVVLHGRTGQRGLEAAELGLAELNRQNIRVLGDIVTKPEVMRRLLESELSGAAYWEVFGPNPEDAERLFNETVEALREFKRLERPGGMRVGLAPHTPHTVSAPLLQKLALFARQNRLPLQLHLAESLEEVAYHQDGGAWPELQALSGGWRPSGLSPVQYVKSLGVLEAQPTLAHMVNVTEDDVRLVQGAGCPVVHCPRSNEALSCGRFPWELYAKHGVSVAFGTDSLGSSPSLSVAEEVRAARVLHGDKASPQALVWAATKGGYRALSLEPPKVLRGAKLSELQAWG